jgi:hypothetical protein
MQRIKHNKWHHDCDSVSMGSILFVPPDVWDVSTRYCGCEGTVGDEVIFTLALDSFTLCDVIPYIFTVNLDVSGAREVRGGAEFHAETTKSVVKGERRRGIRTKPLSVHT